MEPTRKLSLRDLASKSKIVHHVEIEYTGDNYVFPWAELTDAEYPKTEFIDDKLTEDEKLTKMNVVMEKLALSMINKGAVAEGEEVTPEEVWAQLPKRLRTDLSYKIFDIRAKETKDFLPTSKPTPS
ncbi:MAG: hypothetical protein WCK39_00985 [Methanomassiliicoccales archaeon]